MTDDIGKSGVDLSVLEKWMDGHGIGHGAIDGLSLIPGGTQNILVRFARGSREFVLRRPSLFPRAKSNDIIRREIRILGALARTDVPHPQLVAACSDETVMGAAFYLMEPVSGFNPRGTLPAPHSQDRDMRKRMGLALVDGIAALGELDHLAMGLADFGKPERYLERQVGRWKSELEGYGEYAGWAGESDLESVGRIGEWLERNAPTSFKAGLLHGDYHLSNVMYRHDSSEIAAIVDWEMATVGDPLVDLGWLIATWPRPTGEQLPGVVGTSPWDGFPTASELIERYATRSSRNLDSFHWYAVLACYKLGIILEGTYARACAGKAERATGERLHAGAGALFARAEGWIESGAIQ